MKSASIYATIKEAAAGRATEILVSVGGFDPSVLDGKHHPCPRCGGTDRFRRIGEGAGSVHCNQCLPKASGDVIASVAWHRGLSQGDAAKAIAEALGITPPPMASSGKHSNGKHASKKVATNWRAVARKYAEDLGDQPDNRIAFAAALSLPAAAVDVLPYLGKKGDSWTWPEFDGSGDLTGVIGVAVRTADGKKLAEAGCRRGLTIPNGLTDRLAATGILFIVEGASDTLAGFHAGMACIGRPAVRVGGKFLAAWIAKYGAEARIVVVGERDQKPDGKWPGRDDAMEFTSKLAGYLGRSIEFALPPDGVKDVRAALLADDREWAERGATLSWMLTEAAEPIEPSILSRSPEARPVNGDLPCIVVDTDEGRVNREAEQALAGDPDVFTMGGYLVQIVQVRDEPANISPIQQGLLQQKLAETAEWVQIVETKDGTIEKKLHPPQWSVKSIAQWGNYPNVRPLAGVVEFPVLRPDGTIASSYGYDETTHLFIANRTELSVPESPTQADAKQAMESLNELVQDFPFAEEPHRAAWLAGVLTPLIRPAIGAVVPCFLIEANASGVGKLLLIKVTSNILTGRDLGATPDSDEVEMAKKLTTFVRMGRRLVLLDNLTGKFGGASIDAMLTSAVWEERILGQSHAGTWPNNMTIYATGNNVLVGGDTARRIVFIRLETKLENPEERDDVHRSESELIEFIRENRSRFLSDAFTVLRSYIVAGRPTIPMKPWGSFGAWSSIVRASILYAGGADPGDTRVELQSKAGSTAEVAKVLASALASMTDNGRYPVATKEIVDRLNISESVFNGVAGADVIAALETCMREVTGRTLGNWIRQFEKRPLGGYVIHRSDTRGNSGFRWLAEPIGGQHASAVGSDHVSNGQSREPARQMSGTGESTLEWLA